MIQDTNWFWVLLGSAGLLSLVVSFILVFKNKDTTRFFRLRAFSLASLIGYVLGLSSFLFPLGPVSPLQQVGVLAYAIIILLLCVYLLFSPAILYGATLSFNNYNLQDLLEEIPLNYKQEMKEEEQVKEINKKVNSMVPKISLTTEQSGKYRQVIKDHFAETLAFRKQGYAIRDLSNETGIPGYLLSLFINQEYEMNFNELVNAYRVEYLAGLLKTSFNCESYTLEAIGKMAGFNSRTAFIAAIKKYTGMTPSAFFGRKDSETVEYPIFNFPERMRDVA
jgi:AraC-like DNA-binding protein